MHIQNKWLLKYHHWCWGSRAKIPTVKEFILFDMSFVSLLIILVGSLLLFITQVHAPIKRVKADVNYHNDIIYIVDALKERNRLEQKQNELLLRLVDETHEMNRRSRATVRNTDLKQFDDDR